jgi:ADP-heptose:LPS heptosyltransferase
VLVIRRGGLGDTLLMAPICAAVRRAASARSAAAVDLHFAGVAEFAEVLAIYAVVDRAMSTEDLGLWALGLDDDRGERARARMSHYAAIVSDDPVVAAHVRRVPVATFDPRPARDDVPLALQIAAQLDLTVDLGEASLTTRRLAAAATPHRPIVLAPGSGGLLKCWPRTRWLELAALLLAAGRAIEIVVGPTECDRDDPRHWGFAPTATWLTDMPCTLLARRLEGAAAFVGNDSGTTHLAAMLSVPTVALFGPSESRVYRPQGAQVAVVGRRTEGPPNVRVAEVLAALDAVMV